MLKIILIFVYLAYTLHAVGQSSNNCEINLSVENNTYYKHFFVKVTREANFILIQYKIRVKENSEEREYDTNTIKTRQEFLQIRNISPKNDSLSKVLDTLDSLYLAYTTYRIDTLILIRDSFPKFNNIIDKLLITSTDSLQNSRQIYLDATSFTFKLKTKDKQRTVYANSVNKNNHPQLAEFVAETMDLYRSIKNSEFLDRKSTAGY